MSPKATQSTSAGLYRGPGGEGEYWLPRDMVAWEKAWGGVGTPVPARESSDPEDEVDPAVRAARKRRHAEAMTYVRAYTGSWGLILDIRANPRFGMASFRLSERQVEVILAGKARDLERVEKAQLDRELYADDQYQQLLAAASATGRIDPVEPSPARVVADNEPTEGMYRLADGTIAKVQRAIHGSKRLYAKRLVVGEGSGTFEYAPGLIRRLTPEDRMSVEDAATFGKLYGWCCVCGRTLTDEKSIAAGIGPVCARKV